jgi:uncharacterized membrane protein
VEEPAGATAWNKARIEALSDGIFAIVMTLLVLELKVPDLPRRVATDELWHAVREHGPTFFSFFLTFMLASQYWFWHHLTFARIHRVDKPLLWINLMFLMFVSLLPFSTAMVGRFTLHQPVSLGFYFGNQLLITIVMNLHWLYSVKRGLVHDVPATRSITYLVAALLLGPMLAVIMIVVNPDWSFNSFAAGQALAVGFARRTARKAPI